MIKFKRLADEEANVELIQVPQDENKVFRHCRRRWTSLNKIQKSIAVLMLILVLLVILVLIIAVCGTRKMYGKVSVSKSCNCTGHEATAAAITPTAVQSINVTSKTYATRTLSTFSSVAPAVVSTNAIISQAATTTTQFQNTTLQTKPSSHIMIEQTVTSNSTKVNVRIPSSSETAKHSTETYPALTTRRTTYKQSDLSSQTDSKSKGTSPKNTTSMTSTTFFPTSASNNVTESLLSCKTVTNTIESLSTGSLKNITVSREAVTQ